MLKICPECETDQFPIKKMQFISSWQIGPLIYRVEFSETQSAGRELLEIKLHYMIDAMA